MAWTKQVTVSARVTSNNIRLVFYLSDQLLDSEGQALTIKDRLRSQVIIQKENGLETEATDLQVSAHLTDAQTTGTLGVLTELRDAALIELGYTES